MHTSEPNTVRQRMTGAEIMVKMLEQYGITTVAGIPGGAILPFYDALSQSRKIRHILTRHEQAAGFLAQGIARTTGKPAVCIASSGPGATNLLTAIADAKLDSVPLVCITGQVPSSMMGTDAFQEVDTYGIAIPVTKHNYLVRSIADLPSVIQNAFRIAQSGRPGPVWIDVPKDIQTAEIEISALPALLPEKPAPAVSEAQIIAMAKCINQAQRPVIYLGGGVIRAQASDAVQQLAEKANIPFVSTLMALGAIPCQHPLALGMLGMHANRSTNLILQQADLLIVLGARFDDRAIGKVQQFCPHANIIHVDIDRAELGKIKDAHIAINGDLHAVLTAALPHITPQQHRHWRQTIAEFQHAYPCQHRDPAPSSKPYLGSPNAQTDAGAEASRSDDPLTHYGLIRKIAALTDDSAIITTDVGQHQMWVAQAYPFSRPRQLLTSGGLGTMGFGLPAAIGAALAQPDRTVICFTGDGSIMMNLQELATAVEHHLTVKVVLLNNKALGLVHQQQTLFFGERIFSSTFHCQTDFIKIAQGFGMPTCDLNAEADPNAALAHALKQPGPGLIHLRIDINEKVYPMVPPGAANTDMIGE